MSDAVLLTFLIFAVAVLYSSVGQAGGTGYLAAMALVGIAPESMRPAALALNVIVAAVATLRFAQAGQVSLRRLWPFLVASIPLAYIGGSIDLAASVYNPVVGIVLLLVAVRMFIPLRQREPGYDAKIPLGRAIGSGGAIGLLSGLTGTGGGIYLGPLLVLTGWVSAGMLSGTTAAFNLVNSGAALAGNLINVGSLPAAFPVWAVAALAGGYIGATTGSRRLGGMTTQRLLGVILMIAGLRLLISG